MITLSVKGVEYKLRFGNKALAKSGILKDVVNIRSEISLMSKKRGKSDFDTENVSLSMIDELFNINVKLILAAMQKYNDDYKVDYDDENSVKAGTEKVYDFLDDYMDEPDSMDAVTLFSAFVTDLLNSGFLPKDPKAEIALNMNKDMPTGQEEKVIPMEKMTS